MSAEPGDPHLKRHPCAERLLLEDEGRTSSLQRLSALFARLQAPGAREHRKDFLTRPRGQGDEIAFHRGSAKRDEPDTTVTDVRLILKSIRPPAGAVKA
jgi:hypothetical protein